MAAPDINAVTLRYITDNLRFCSEFLAASEDSFPEELLPAMRIAGDHLRTAQEALGPAAARAAELATGKPARVLRMVRGEDNGGKD